MDTFVLFGDSLTQRGFEVSTGGWAALLANEYIRRADIIDRGYGGYTTEWCKYVLPDVLNQLKNYNVRLFVLFLGANDAVLAGRGNQHTPLPQYKTNLKLLLNMVREAFPKTKLLIMTPPAFHPGHWEAHRKNQGRVLDRDTAVTREYAQACIQIGQDMGVPVVDLHTAMDEFAGSSSQPEQAYWDRMSELLIDGLHFSKEGNALVFQQLKSAIAKNYPELDSQAMRMKFPYHGDVDVTRLQDCIKM